MKTIDEIKRHHRNCCVITRLKEPRCTIRLPPGQYLAIGGTEYQDNHNHAGKLCDCILFWDDSSIGSSIAVLELKGGQVPPSKSITQLQEGADLARKLIQANPSGFAAILVTRRGTHSIDRKVIARRRIIFNGVRYPVQVIRCGMAVTSAKPWRQANGS